MQKVQEPSAEMVRQCAAGNRAAFRELFHMYRSYAYNLIYKIAGPGANHEDLIQDVFFQVYLSLKTFKGDSLFRTWFHRLVIHACTRQWRYQNTSKRISPKKTLSLDAVEYGLTDRETPTSQRLELRDLVNKALDTLDISVRVPLVLHIYSEMELAEIAEILEIPEGTVKSRLHAARQQIKEYLDAVGASELN